MQTRFFFWFWILLIAVSILFMAYVVFGYPFSAHHFHLDVKAEDYL